MLDVVQKGNLTYHVGYSWSIWTSDEIREKVIEHDYIPTKGIPYKIFAFGPYEPPKFSKQAEIFPEET